jgi:hypothetical protein
VIETDFFDVPEADVPRGLGGSPLLVPEGVDPSSNIRAEYSRASALADWIEDKEHIHKWEMRYLAKAMGQNEDLAALAACEVYSTGVSDAVYGREKTQSGRNLDSIIERAFDRVRLHEKADRGTAVHGFTEPRWWAQEPHEAVPERLRGPVGAFWEINRRECIEIVDTERFTANDITMSAGTFDHLVRIPGHPLFKNKLVVADKKTGSFEPFSWCVQISTYAYGKAYNTATHTRPGWPGEVCLEWGLVWQIDCEPDTDNQKRIKLWVINLEFGWEMAQLASKVRDGHSRKDIAVQYRSPTFEQRLEASNTRDDLERLWRSTNNRDLQIRVEEKARSL